MELAGKTVVLTGASRGIGRALSVGLTREGCRLLLTALEADELAALAEELRGKYSANVATMASDLTDAAGRSDLIEWVTARPQPPDILVNNAGAGLFRRFESSSWLEIEKQLVLNIHAATHLIHQLIPVLKARPVAKIVNISSGVARLPYPGLAVYGAAKGFVSSLSESLACELSGTPVSVLCFHPGFTTTPFIAAARMDMSRIPRALVSTPEKVATRILAAIRKDRLWDYGDPAARLMVFLSSFMTPGLKTTIFKHLFWRLPDEA